MLAPVLQLDKVTKTFATPARRVEVLRDATGSLARSESAALLGPSGSGKTTLLGLCAGLERPTSGALHLNGRALHDLDEEARAALRRQSIGFVFQNYQLIPTLTALENVCIPLELQRADRIRDRARDWLDRVGLGDRLDHYPVQLSGGEQQRVAIARACVHEPAILFADEPTGNLDETTGAQIEDLLFALHRETGNTLLLVTHDAELASRADRRWRLRQGVLIEAD